MIPFPGVGVLSIGGLYRPSPPDANPTFHIFGWPTGLWAPETLAGDWAKLPTGVNRSQLDAVGRPVIEAFGMAAPRITARIVRALGLSLLEDAQIELAIEFRANWAFGRASRAQNANMMAVDVRDATRRKVLTNSTPGKRYQMVSGSLDRRSPADMALVPGFRALRIDPDFSEAFSAMFDAAPHLLAARLRTRP